MVDNLTEGNRCEKSSIDHSTIVVMVDLGNGALQVSPIIGLELSYKNRIIYVGPIPPGRFDGSLIFVSTIGSCYNYDIRLKNKYMLVLSVYGGGESQGCCFYFKKKLCHNYSKLQSYFQT